MSNVDNLKYLKRAMLYRREWVSTEKWYNPMTWGNGYYIESDGSLINRPQERTTTQREKV